MRRLVYLYILLLVQTGCQTYQTVEEIENKSELNRYLQHLSKKIEIIGASRHPDLHKLVQTTTQIEIEMLIKKNGKLLGARLIRSSNNAALDELMMDIINYAAPHPPIPDELNVNVLKINKIWMLSPER